MKRRRIHFHGIAVLWPWLTVALLVGLSLPLPNSASIDQHAIEHHASVARAIAAAPYFIGSRWTGEDTHQLIAREAQQLLRPNAILSRAYSAPGGPVVHVLVVHCGDARDMIGHYPPVCYPSAGWSEMPQTDDGVRSVHTGDRVLAMREYTFSRPRDRITNDNIRVLNAFILPDGSVTPHFDEIYRQTDRLSVAVMGVAQIQVMTSASTPIAESLTAAAEVLAGLAPIFDAMNVAKELNNDRETLDI